jgi:hypothetical protein
MAEQEMQTTENKSRIGTAILLPVATIVGSTIGAVVGFGGLEDIFNRIPEVSIDGIDSLSEQTRGLNGHEVIIERATRTSDSIASALEQKIRELSGIGKDAGEGLSELHKTTFGIGSTEEARKAIGEAIFKLDDNHIKSSEIITNFAQSEGGAKIIPYGEDYLMRDSGGNIFIVDDEKLKALDPRIAGGVLPALDRLNDGMNPQDLTKSQEQFRETEINWGDIGVKTAVGTAVGLTAGVAVKSSVESNQQMTQSQHASYLASPKIEPTTANYLGLAMKSKELNRAMG